MAAIRIGISGVLGMLVTLALVVLMYKLIDSGSKELDESDAIKIPDFLHVERETTENAKKTNVVKPDEPDTKIFSIYHYFLRTENYVKIIYKPKRLFH